MMTNTLENKTILLTGGTGFLGSNLITRLCSLGTNLIVLKRQASDLWRLPQHYKNKAIFYNIEGIDFKTLLKRYSPDVIVHCATNYGTKIASITELIDANLILPLKILEAMASVGMDIPFINTDTVLDYRINAYSLSKQQFLQWLEFYSNYFPCINIKLEHFYGPFDNRSKFCTKIILDLINQVDVIDLTPGMQKRDFIYIDDVIDAFEVLINYGLKIQSGLHPFQLGSGKNLTIHDFIVLIKKLTNNSHTTLNFGAYPYRPNEVMEYPLDLSALSSLGWEPRHSLQEGLLKTIHFEKTFLQRNQQLCAI